MKSFYSIYPSTHGCEQKIQYNTSMPSYNILFFFILISFLSFPPTKAEDSIAIYLYKICSNTTTTTISNNNSAFQFDLRTLLTSLSSKATGDTQFSTSTVIGSTNPSDSVYGLFMCRGDDDSQLCQQCIGDATLQLFSECSSSKQAVIWYDECMVRYSNRNFFSAVDTQPKFVYLNPLNVSNPESLLHLVYKAMNATADEAASGDEKIKYATREVTVSDSESHTIYIQAQCTPDLSPRDCRTCLSDAIGEFPKCCVAKKGGRVMYPSCNIRYEPDPFYHTISTSPTPAPPLVSATTNITYSPQTQTNSPSRSTEKQSNRGRTIILIVVPAVILVMLFSFGCYFLKRKARKSHLTILREKNFGKESATLEPLQFDFPIIEAATNNFSQENYIGKGGFGKVYKGILLDGQQIAVKRLSESSKQGVDEFKNEVLLIAKLQHRNLVAFIGFCLEEQEKILVYEYVPNKSLDYFLFDSRGPNPLSWDERYNIIGGIARGIIYLHEHSRLKVIHRDLKPSNVLLDENMIPKISDFGLARIVEINQVQGSTNRIVGTYGYMSPEYAMLGKFSEKSDVFSFGVMILEIVTGKKNLTSWEPQPVSNGLLSYVWRQLKDQTPLSVLDINIKENYSEIEIIKCIQIGLLCVQHNPNDRPTMSEIVSYLSGYSIDLPTPQEPTFFLHTRMNPNPQESSSTKSGNNSINQVSTSTFLPR